MIARNTAFSFKGKNVDAREIGRELGVRYVLEGSVQRDQNRVRVNAQLIDAGSGAHLGADRFEEDVADLFKLQDQVVAQLADGLGYELVMTGGGGGNSFQKSRRCRSRHARVGLGVAGTAGAAGEGEQQCGASLVRTGAQDRPERKRCAGGRRLHLFFGIHAGMGARRDRLRGKNTRSGQPGHRARPRQCVGVLCEKLEYLTVSQRANEGLSAANTELAINPDDPQLYRARSLARNNACGRYEQAKSDVQQAMRLSPRDPMIGIWLMNLGDAELALGHFDAAIDKYKKAIDAGWRAYQPYRGLTAAYALDGKMEEATSASQKRGAQLPLSLSNGCKPIHRTCRRWPKACASGLPEE